MHTAVGFSCEFQLFNLRCGHAQLNQTLFRVVVEVAIRHHNASQCRRTIIVSRLFCQ